MKSTMNEVVHQFAYFLNKNWDIITRTVGILEHLEADVVIADWIQTNWELLVETPFRDYAQPESVFLEPYGEGADCNDKSSRVWNPKALPTHRIMCLPTQPTELFDLLAELDVDPAKGPILFDHFATQSKSGWHEESSPFDCVLGYQSDREVLIRVNDLMFTIESNKSN